MGNARFLGNQLVTAAAILTPSSNASGVISNPQKEGSGSGTVVLAGDFTGTADLDYVILISLAGEVGVAKFDWSDDGGVTWDVTAVLTATTAVALNNGITVAFVGGSGTDFVLNDVFRFKAFLPFGKAKMIDRDRDTEWRSASDVSAAINVVADFTSAKQVDVLAILDHNLSSGATIRIQGSSASDFSTTPVDEAVTWRSGLLLHYVTTSPRSFRYWRARVTDTGNADKYLRWAELYLGTYTELGQSFELGDERTKVRMAGRQQMASGRWIGGLNTVVTAFNLRWRYLSKTDKDNLITIYDALNDLTNRQVKPLFFNPDSAVLADCFLCEWEGQFEYYAEPTAPDTFDVPCRLVEQPRTV